MWYKITIKYKLLIHTIISFHLNGRYFLQTHGLYMFLSFWSFFFFFFGNVTPKNSGSALCCYCIYPMYVCAVFFLHPFIILFYLFFLIFGLVLYVCALFSGSVIFEYLIFVCFFCHCCTALMLLCYFSRHVCARAHFFLWKLMEFNFCCTKN